MAKMISNSELVKTIKKQGFATEQQINLIKRRINKSDESASEMFNLLDSVMPIRLTEEQKNKAAKWICDKNFKKNGDCRKNCILGIKDEYVVTHPKYLYLKSFYAYGNYYHDCVYDLFSHSMGFQYIIGANNIKIIG